MCNRVEQTSTDTFVDTHSNIVESDECQVYKTAICTTGIGWSLDEKRRPGALR